MSSASDALANPTQAIQFLYSQQAQEFPGAVTEHFRRVFAQDHEFQRIPTLDLAHPPASFVNGSLVLFRAMVQDTSISPELYLAAHKNGKCGGWGITDDLTSGEDVQHDDLRECTVAWGVSIPGLSTWCFEETISSTMHGSVQPHKYPISNAPHIGVQLKIYDGEISSQLRTTDLASFVGILTSEPLHTAVEVSDHLLVPTLHVLFSVPISSSIIPRTFPKIADFSTSKSLRDDLVEWIAEEALAGDRIAAEWVLLCTVSRVRSRHPPIVPLSLTISGFPVHSENATLLPALSSVLSLLLPLVSATPLSPDALNKDAFCPESKNEDLHSGRLQLPKGSIAFLSEGGVTEGSISTKGIMNIRAIQDMMKAQTLDYIFPFSSFLFETDVTFITTTEGKKSTFFQTDINIPLRPRISNGLQAKLYKPVEDIALLPPEKLSDFRELVAAAKIGDAVLGEAVGKYIEEEFIRERSLGNSNGTTSGFTPDDLIQRMLVTRLHALSLHQTEVKKHNWQGAKELEKELKSRK